MTLKTALDAFFQSGWFIVLACVVGLVYLSALLWKILTSEEGYLFGYGKWVIGKWQKVTGAKHGSREEPADRDSRFSFFSQQRRRDISTLRRDVQLQSNVLQLSRLLDGDLAYLMMHEVDEWETKIVRALQTLVSGITRVVHPNGNSRCGFFILDDDEESLRMVAGEGYLGFSRPRLALEHSCAGRAFLTGEDYYCRDTESDPVYWHSSRGNTDFRSIACVPVRAGQVVFGVICLDAPEVDAFSPADFAYLEVFAAKLSVFCAFHSLQVAVGSPTVRREGGD